MNEITIIPESNIQITTSSYGKYSVHSMHCPICLKTNHMEINLLRARDHMTLKELHDYCHAQGLGAGVTMDKLKTHFKSHYIVAPSHRDVINLKEEGSSEALDIVSKIFDGDVDLFSGSKGLLEIKAKRLNAVNARLDFINGHIENDSADDIDKQEFVSLNKIATDIEDSMERILSIIDKKFFPSSKEDVSKAVLQYKLGILSKLIDHIQASLIELEKVPEYTKAVIEIRRALSSRIGSIEDEIVRSGNMMNGG